MPFIAACPGSKEAAPLGASFLSWCGGPRRFSTVQGRRLQEVYMSIYKKSVTDSSHFWWFSVTDSSHMASPIHLT